MTAVNRSRKKNPAPGESGDGSDNKRPPTIADVAERAGVAIGTVSRHLAGAPLRRANREQVERAISEMGYRRNALAAAMKTDTTGVIGLLVPAFDDYHARILERLAKLVRQTGRALLTYCHSNEPRIFRDALNFFGGQRVDALILDGMSFGSDYFAELNAAKVPIIVYNDVIDGIAADHVVVDNHQASYRAVSHLLDLGHRNIAILHGALEHSTARERLSGYQSAMQERGLTPFPVAPHGGNWSADSAYTRMRAVMGQQPAPTAIFCSNYQITVGALTWLKEHNLRIPDDISLVSFDDIDLFRLHSNGITAIAQPLSRIAESIADLLIVRLTPPHDGITQTVTLNCDIVLRGSTMRINSA